jgi:hypothetical protein
VQGGHRSEFVGEAVVGPDRSFAAGTVDCVYETGGLLVHQSIFQYTQKVRECRRESLTRSFLPFYPSRYPSCLPTAVAAAYKATV